MTNMDTNLRGRLRNTSLPKSNGLFPLFEAVVNSIHSIEDAKRNGSGKIDVYVIRGDQQHLDFAENNGEPKADEQDVIVGFRIVDNGNGFDDTNMNSFRTLDSEYKVSRGGRGVGRLLWLKAFRQVHLESVFRGDDGKKYCRKFTFTADRGVTKETIEKQQVNSRYVTTIQLGGFVKRYRDATAKSGNTIANALLEHCLWYFVRDGGVPTISVIDGDDKDDLDQIFEYYMVENATNETVEICGQDFDLTHTKLRAASTRNHAMALCAASRLVKEENLTGKIPGLFGRLTDNGKEFNYVCYVASTFLDERVRSERTDFDISENSRALFADQEVSLSDIRDAVLERARAHLSEYLSANVKNATERVNSFVANRAPRYRPVLSRMAVDEMAIDPDVSDKELELTLYKGLAEVESKLIEDGHDLMSPSVESEGLDEYHDRLKEYLKAAEDIKKSDLANYVFHRKVILDLLQKAIQRKDGKYVREDLIHTLLMPMRVDSNQILPDDCNLWVVDESLAFHDYLASDKTLASMPITKSRSGKEPDIASLNVFDNPILVSEGQKLPLASIVVVEIKRPMRDDAKEGEAKDPIEQALGYLDRIRDGDVLTATGRPIPQSKDIPGFCYILCDITPSIRKRCKMHDAIESSDNLGFFFYKTSFRAYVEVISFDGLVNRAKERNRAFFDRLGLPTN